MFSGLFAHKLSDTCINKRLKSLLSHKVTYWIEFEYNLYFSASILQLFDESFDFTFHLWYLGDKANKIKNMGKVFLSGVHIFCRVVCFAELFQSIIFWAFFSCVDLFVFNFQPEIVWDKSFDDFFTEFLILWIEYDDFFVLEIQVDGILFVFCNLISINENFNVHLVIFFREFLVNFQIPDI